MSTRPFTDTHVSSPKLTELTVHHSSWGISWVAPHYLRAKTDEEHDKTREKHHIMTEGDEVPPPCAEFQVSPPNQPSELTRPPLPSPARPDESSPPLSLARFFFPLQDMKLPAPILKYLKGKKIVKPSPIQIQGIPTASVRPSPSLVRHVPSKCPSSPLRSILTCSCLYSLRTRRFSGRDMIGIAFTGSGKTLAFSLPAIMLALEEEGKMPLAKGEGPVAMIVCPSVRANSSCFRSSSQQLTPMTPFAALQRELARQTYEGIQEMCAALAEGGYPQLGVLLTIGGISMQEQNDVLSKGLHIVVATPGRVIDMLTKKRFGLEGCK